MKKITITLLSLIASASFAQTNLFTNPNFDTDISGWTTQAGFSGAVNTFAFDAANNVDFPGDTATSSGSLEMTVSVISNPVNDGASSIRQTIDFSSLITPSGPTTFSGVIWVSSTTPTGGVGTVDRLAMQVFSENGGFQGIAFPSFDITADGTFQRVDFTFDIDLDSAPAGFDPANTRVLFAFADSVGTYGFDRATLIQGTIAEAIALSADDFNKDGVSVYPIPATSEVNIQGNVSGDSVTIYDISGSLVGSSTIEGDFNTVDVSTLAKGVYFMQLENGSVLKFVK